MSLGSDAQGTRHPASPNDSGVSATKRKELRIDAPMAIAGLDQVPVELIMITASCPMLEVRDFTRPRASVSTLALPSFTTFSLQVWNN